LVFSTTSTSTPAAPNFNTKLRTTNIGGLRELRSLSCRARILGNTRADTRQVRIERGLSEIRSRIRTRYVQNEDFREYARAYAPGRYLARTFGNTRI
jgi:hypothetical protein